jgi:hypothetical protein
MVEHLAHKELGIPWNNDPEFIGMEAKEGERG